jgi:Tetratricopeptide repeat
MRYIINVVLFLFLFSFVKAEEYKMSYTCNKAYEHILMYDFAKGQKLLTQEKSENPENLIVYWLEDYIDFYKVLSHQNYNEYENLKQDREERIDILKDGNEDSPFYSMCLAEVYIHRAIERILFEEYFDGALDINRAYKLLESNTEDFPSFLPTYKCLGVLHALIGLIPPEYEWIKSLVNIRGSMTMADNELTTVINLSLDNEEWQYLAVESFCFYSLIKLNTGDIKTATKKIDYYLQNPYLQKMTSVSPMLNFVQAKLFMAKKQTDQAISTLLNFRQSEEDIQYRIYYLGLLKLRRQDENAKNYFLQYLSQYNGKQYIKSSYQKLAWAYFIEGDTLSYQKNIQNVIYSGTNKTDEDKQAQKEALSLSFPNYYLLKTRLLFDGGYYKLALQTLMEEKMTMVCRNEEEKLEYIYRVARIFHGLGKMEKAIKYYKSVVDKKNESRSHFPANSALFLGQIYEESGDYSTAKKYYQECLNMDFDSYHNSICQKAKAGLERL